MKRRVFLAACAASLSVAAAPARADRVSLSALSRYFNGFSTAASDFTQVNADGTISTGQLFIHRPGRARFEYKPPDESLVIAGGGQVAVFDGKSNTGPEQFPLVRTPLNLILARQVDLSRNGMVVAHQFDGTTTNVIAQDPDHPEYGNIRLVFSDDPVELRQWVITDEGGQQTTVILGKLQKGAAVNARMFSIVQEARERGLTE
ncbi:MAG: outer membrane lipoprotein carrier protein LolA [Pseudomonadota bacterium]